MKKWGFMTILSVFGPIITDYFLIIIIIILLLPIF